MAEGLDLYDDVLTTGAEMPVGPEDEVLQVQVRTQSDKHVSCRNNLLFLNWSNNNNLRKTKTGMINSLLCTFSHLGEINLHKHCKVMVFQLSKYTLTGLHFKCG